MKTNTIIMILLTVFSQTAFSEVSEGYYSGGGFSSGGMFPGIGMGLGPGQQQGPLQDNEQVINMLAMNIDMSISGGELVREGDAPQLSTTAIKEVLENLGLNKSENLLIRDKVLSRAFAMNARKPISIDFENNPGQAGYKANDKFDNLMKTLDALAIPLPTGYSDAVTLKEINKEVSNPTDYLKSIKSKFGTSSEAYKNALKDGMYNFAHTPESKKSFILAMIESGADQQFLGQMLQMEMGGGMMGATPIPGLAELIAKYYDFSTPYLGSDNMLCMSVTYLNNTLSVPSGETGGPSWNIGGMGGFDEDEDEDEDTAASTKYPKTDGFKRMQQEMADFTKKNAYRLIELGADPNIRCSNGQKFSDIIEDLKRAGVYAKEDFSFGSLHIGKPCVGEVAPVDLSGMCDTVKVVKSLQQILEKNEAAEAALAKKITTIDVRVNEHITGYEDGKCTILIFDKHVSELNTTLSRNIRIDIESKSTKKTHKLSSADKESFLKELDKVLKKP